MQFVYDPQAAIQEAKGKPKRGRAKKEKAQTPSEYCEYYSHMSQSLEGGKYYPRAQDKGGVYTRQMREAIKKRNQRGRHNSRPVIFSERGGSSSWSRPLFGARYMTPDEILNIQAPNSNEDDLQAILDFAQQQKDENTKKTTLSRIKMLFGMLGDVQEIKSLDWYRFQKPRVVFLQVKDFQIAVIPPEE